MKKPRNPRIRIRQPLRPKPSAEKVKRFTEAGKPFQWRPGQSGNPSGGPKGKGSKKNYAEFIEACRELSPRALERLREALNLPWTKQTARTILTAAALVIERGYGRAVAVSIDASPDRTAPTIPLNENYWRDMTSALIESGAIAKPVDPDARVVDDAEVVDVEVKQIEPPRP